MKCPVCNKDLNPVIYEDQEIDICPKCRGIWFDKSELTRVVDSLLSKGKIDSQTIKDILRKKKIGVNNIKKVYRKCPKCKIEMGIYNYSYDSNIFVDKCPKCGGIWTNKGEMYAIAKYVRGNSSMDRYAKALVSFGSKRQEKKINKGTITALTIAIIYLLLGYGLEGVGGLAKALFFIILPLSCIFFGKELGGKTGIRFRTSFLAPVITKSTPGSFVVFIGWVLLLFPAIVAILLSL
jgi:uncharacterized protein